jgi:uncharacterized protein YggE
MKMRNKKLGILAVVLCLAFGIVGCSAQIPSVSVGSNTNELTSQLVVVGESSISVEPDLAMITVGVESYDATAEAAQQANATNMNQVLDQLNQAGIDKKDIQTVSYNIWPNYDYGMDNSQTIIGYYVSNSVKVTVRDVTRVGTLIGDLSAAGMNQSYGIEFGIADKESVYKEALAEAVKNAEEKATFLAESANVSITGLVKVVEGGAESSYGPYLSMEKAEGMGYDVGISTGTLDVSARVEAVYGVK